MTFECLEGFMERVLKNITESGWKGRIRISCEGSMWRVDLYKGDDVKTSAFHESLTECVRAAVKIYQDNLQRKADEAQAELESFIDKS